MEDNAPVVGGFGGGMLYCLLQVDISQVASVALYALVGAAVGEGVKEGIKLVKKAVATYKKHRDENK